jgi:DNA-binding protein Fis
MIRDFATIDATQQLLDNFKCDWANLNGLPLIRFDVDQAEKDIIRGKITLDDVEQRWTVQQSMLSQNKDHWDEYLADREVVELYKSMFSNIKEPLLNRILKNNQRPNFGDKHPKPSESLDYINDVLPNNLQVTEFVNYWELQVDNIKTKDRMPSEFVRNSIQRF